MIPNTQRININNLRSSEKLQASKQSPFFDKKGMSPKQSVPSLISSPPTTPKIKVPSYQSNSK
jgi:hypothetical protein